MLTLSVVLFSLLSSAAVFSYSDDHCCCGCQYPCPVSIPSRCGASPTTSCADKDLFNSSELLSPCDLIIKLHDLTGDISEERNGQPVPIGKDKNRPNSVTVTDASSAPKEKNLPSLFARLFSFPKFVFSDIPHGEVVKNETTKENGTLIKETVRRFPGGMESTKVIVRNETDPVKARQRWREIMGRVRAGIGRMDDDVTNMQHGMIESFDSLFKGVLDGVFNILRAR